MISQDSFFIRKRLYLSQPMKVAVKKRAFWVSEHRSWSQTDWVQHPMPFLIVWPHTTQFPSLRFSFWLCKMGRKKTYVCICCVNMWIYTLHPHDTFSNMPSEIPLTTGRPMDIVLGKEQDFTQSTCSTYIYVSGLWCPHKHNNFYLKTFWTHLLATKQPHFTPGEHTS